MLEVLKHIKISFFDFTHMLGWLYRILHYSCLPSELCWPFTFWYGIEEVIFIIFFLLDTVVIFVLSFQKLLDFFLFREILKKETNSIWHVWILIIFHNFLLESQELVFIDRLGNVPFHSVLNFYFSRVCLDPISLEYQFTLFGFTFTFYMYYLLSHHLYIFFPHSGRV